MDAVMRAAIGGQFGAAINTLREAIEHCPDSLWDDRTEGAPFWQLAYHTLFCLDMYSTASLKALRPARFHVEDAQFLAGDYPWLEPPRTIRARVRVQQGQRLELSARVSRALQCDVGRDDVRPRGGAMRISMVRHERRRAAALESPPRHASHWPTHAAAASPRGNWCGLDRFCRASGQPERQPALDHV